MAGHEIFRQSDCHCRVPMFRTSPVARLLVLSEKNTGFVARFSSDSALLRVEGLHREMVNECPYVHDAH